MLQLELAKPFSLFRSCAYHEPHGSWRPVRSQFLSFRFADNSPRTHLSPVTYRESGWRAPINRE